MSGEGRREADRDETWTVLISSVDLTPDESKPKTALSSMACGSSAGRRDNENDIALWQAGAHSGGDDGNAGIIARILGTCIESLAYLAQLPDKRPTLKRDRSLLRRCAKLLKLWANGHGAWDGRLDSLLDRSRNLRHTTLSILSPLCKVLYRGTSSE